MVTTKDSTEYYSTGAVDLNVVFADMDVCNEAELKKSTAVIDNCWLGRFADSSHCMVIKRKRDGLWFLAMHYFPNSAVLVWPVTMHRIPGHLDHCHYTNATNVVEPTMVPLSIMADWQAVSYTLRSPAWQQQNWTRAKGKIDFDSVKLVSTDKLMSIPQTAALNAFYRLTHSFVGDYMKFVGKPAPAGASRVEMFVHAVVNVLGVTVNRALEILQFRLAAILKSTRFCDELLSMDEVDECLDHNDVKQMHDWQEKASHAIDDESDFRKEYVAMVASEGAAAAKPAKKPKTAKSGVSELPPADGIPQHEAKLYIPAGGNIWKDNLRGGWQVHFPPFERESFSLKKYGTPGECLLHAYRHLWPRYCWTKGIDVKGCPFKGMFVEPPAAAGSGSSSSGAAAA